VVTHQLKVEGATESSPVKDRRSTTVTRHLLIIVNPSCQLF